MTFSNVNLLNKALLTVVLMFFKVKIRKAFHCSVVSSEDLLKLNYFKSYLCHLIRKFSNFLQFYLSLVYFFLDSYEMCVCFLILHCIIYASYSNSFFVSLIYFGSVQMVL